MNIQSKNRKPLVESVSPNKIVLNAQGKFPRDVEIFDDKSDVAIKYRIVKTKTNNFMFNK